VQAPARRFAAPPTNAHAREFSPLAARLSGVIAVLLVLASLGQGADFNTYIGDAFSYHVAAIATDAAGNTYVTGSRAIPTSPPVSSNAFETTASDVFVTKLDASGQIVFTATLSGKGNDQGNAIAVDSAGNILIAGTTNSTNFPLRHPLQSVPSGSYVFPGSNDTGFVAGLGPDGTLLFSTYLGGTKGGSSMNGIAADGQGNIYVTGSTNAPDYPRTPGLPAGGVSPGPLSAISGAFFAKISASGDRILWAGAVAADLHACSGGSSCFLSPLYTSGVAIAVDAAGNADIAGNTNGTGLPVAPGALLSQGIGAFVMKVNTDGMSLGYLTFLGSANYLAGPYANPGNTAAAIALDAAGNAYLTGSTSDPDFPATAGSYQPAFSIDRSQINPFEKPPADAFVAKLNPTGSAVVWASFLGGKEEDDGQSLAVDPVGNVWVSGVTRSPDFPAGPGNVSGSDFLAEFNADGTALPYGSVFPSQTVAQSISLDSSGVLHAAGATGIVSTFTPSQTNSLRIYGIGNAAGGELAGRIASGELISIYGLHLGPATPVSAAFDETGFLPTTLSGVQVTIGGVPVPLLYVSDTQINAVTPMQLTGPADAQLQITVNGVALPAFRTAVDAVDPQIFRNADGSAAAINQDGTVNSQSHPAKSGTYVSIWATGTGAFAGMDGQRAESAQYTCSCSILDDRNMPYAVSYSGTSPGLVNGVTQVNFQVPQSTSPGAVDFLLSVGGKVSDFTHVYVSP
jgi:uncharacterized protein (TIGR03437 family)